MAVKIELEKSPLPKYPTFHHSSPLEWRKPDGIGKMLRRLSDFLVFPRQMAFALMAEPSSPVSWSGSLPPEGNLEKMLKQGSARIHLQSWLGYSAERGWYSKRKEPPLFRPVDGVFPSRLGIYGEKDSFARVICSFRPMPGDSSRMGRLGVFFGKNNAIFIGERGGGLEITPIRKSMGTRERDFSFYIQTALSVLQENPFNLDIWIPYEVSEGIVSAKLFGAFFKKSLFEIVAS